MRLKMFCVDPGLKVVINKSRKKRILHMYLIMNLRNKFIKFYSIKNKKVERKKKVI